MASDFTCKRLYTSGGSGGAATTWCYAEVIPTEPEKGRLLHTLTSHLPLPAHYLHGATRLAHLLLLSSPHMPAELADELQQPEDEAPRDGAGTLWAEFVAFFVGALQPSGGAEVTDEAFGELLGLLCQVETAPSL